jgi:Ca2+-binding EF-hand superfamily protein
MKPPRRTTAAILLGLCASLSVGTSPAAAQDIGAIDDGIFKSADLNGDGKISRREILHFTDLVFLSADTNGDDILTVEEFLKWDPGYLFIAEQTGKTVQLNTAKREVYAAMDINGDGSLEHDEFSAASLYDFYRADLNSDRVLSQEEFIGEYRMVNAVRSAIE